MSAMGSEDAWSWVIAGAHLGALGYLALKSAPLSRRKPRLIGTVVKLSVHPLKSGAEISVNEAVITNAGMCVGDVYDRRLMVARYSEQQKKVVFATARQYPKLVTIHCVVENGNVTLSGSHPARQGAQKSVTVQLPSSTEDAQRETADIWGTPITGIKCGDEVGRWLSDYLDVADLRLLYCAGACDFKRMNFAKKSEQVLNRLRNDDLTAYTDWATMLVIGTASLDALNEKLSERGRDAVSMRNFRPNIVIETSEAHIEDRCDTMFIVKAGKTIDEALAAEAAKLRCVERSARCILTTVHPDEAVKSPHEEPLSTLRTYRLYQKQYKRSPLFGMNCAVDCEGDIAVGDEIWATEGDHGPCDPCDS